MSRQKNKQDHDYRRNNQVGEKKKCALGGVLGNQGARKKGIKRLGGVKVGGSCWGTGEYKKKGRGGCVTCKKEKSERERGGKRRRRNECGAEGRE